MSEHSIRWINNKPNHYQTVLYIGRPSSTLADHLYNALANNGALSITLHPDSKLISPCTPYNCYILDADFLGEVSTVMRRIFNANPDARVLVVSDAYDWQDAVYAFENGAIDVIRHPRSSMATYHILEMVMNQTLPRYRKTNARVN